MIKKGIVVVSGGIGVGKTALALTTGIPFNEIGFMNLDGKEPQIDGDPKEVFGWYDDFRNSEGLDFMVDGTYDFRHAWDSIHKLPEDLSVMLIDNFPKVFKSMQHYAEKHWDDIIKTGWAKSATWKNKQIKGLPNSRMVGKFLDELQQKVPLVILTGHIVPEWEENPDDASGGGVKTGRHIPDVSWSLAKMATFHLKLVRSDMAVPDAIVLKNVGVYRNGVGPITVFPPKLNYRALPDWEERVTISVWDIIRHYYQNPLGMRRKLEVYETPTEEEQAEIAGIMTNEQKEILRWNRQAKMLEDTVLTASVRELMRRDTPLMAMWGELRDNYPHVTLMELKQYIEMLKEEKDV